MIHCITSKISIVHLLHHNLLMIPCIMSKLWCYSYTYAMSNMWPMNAQTLWTSVWSSRFAGRSVSLFSFMQLFFLYNALNEGLLCWLAFVIICGWLYVQCLWTGFLLLQSYCIFVSQYFMHYTTADWTHVASNVTSAHLHCAHCSRIAYIDLRLFTVCEQ